jgi:peptide-N4-(N-acetyl-beta-glucosaminyl)asparagine amidase
LYEKGWGKTLSRVVAFGRAGVKDVTRRYVVDFDATVAARTRGVCDDAWLERALRDASARARAACEERTSGGGGGDAAAAAAAAAAIDAKRNADEDDELAAAAACATSREGDHQEMLPGRKTGSVAWRAARGELGDAVSAAKAEAEEAEEIEPAPSPPGPEDAEKVALSDEVKAAYAAQEAELKAEFRKLVSGGMAKEEAATTAVANVKKARARAPRAAPS